MTNVAWGLLGPEALACGRRTRTLGLGAVVRLFNDHAVPGLGGVWFGKQVLLTPEGHIDPVLQHAAGVAIAQWHYDTFSVPAGAVQLARSTNEECPHPEAFRIGDKVYGLQFHPEPTAEMIFRDRWFRQRPSEDEAVRAEAAGRMMLEAWVRIAMRI